MTRLLFVTRSLNVGGAERQLCELARGLSGPDFAVTVVAFYDGGELKEELETIPRIRTISLGKRSRWDVWSGSCGDYGGHWTLRNLTLSTGT
jgi:hypothetical protein